MSYPPYFIIDIVGGCNLRCRFCAEGQKINQQPQKMMSKDEFKKLSASILPHAEKIAFSNWSEPFLNKDIFDIVKHIKAYSRKIKVGTSTNANYFTESMAEKLIESGMDWIFISISGAINEIYQKYHQGGDIHKVFKSVEYITRAKKEKASKLPYLGIRYLQFPFNYISLRKLKLAFLRALKDKSLFEQIDKFVINYGMLTGSDLTPEERILYYGHIPVFRTPYYLKFHCGWIFNESAIRSDGTVFPCCAVVYNSRNALGNLKSNSFEEIWSSQKYKTFRDEFKKGKNKLCNACALYYPKYFIQFNRLLPHQLKARLWWQKQRLAQMLISRYNIDISNLRSRLFALGRTER